MPRPIAALLALTLLLAACGGDADTTTDPPTEDAAAASEEPTDVPAEDGGETAADDDGVVDEPDGDAADDGELVSGTVTLGDEVISLTNGFCFDEPEEVIGSPGMILLTAVLRGTNAAGEPVVFDLTRFDEDAMFTGDDLLLDIGELDMDTGETSVGSYSARLELGEAGEGDTLAASGFTWTGEELPDQPGAFEISC